MTITLITDCHDPNATGRQSVRLSGLFGTTPTIIGVHSDLEASGNLIDAIDAAESRPGVYIVNVAPRNGQAKKWPNGTPFCYFRFHQSLIISSLDGLALSLAKKLGIVRTLRVLDIPNACQEMIASGALDPTLADAIRTTQFRSYEFLPRVAHYLSDGRDLAGENWPISEIADAPHAMWWIDNFGNAKTTVLDSDLAVINGHVDTIFGTLPFYSHLSEVPDRTTALTRGSSGLGTSRFVELVIQGESAEEKYRLTSGQAIFSHLPS